MLFESIETLNEMIGLIRSGPQQTEYPGQFHDVQDPEVDKLYCSSPFETELVGTFELDTPLGENEKEKNVESTEEAKANKTNFETNPILSSHHRGDDLFKLQEIPIIPDGPAPPSSLALLLNGGGKVAAGSPMPSRRKGGIALTIYLPNREPISINFDTNNSVDDLIRSVLSSHKNESGGEGSDLHYHAPECYELRLHEGDGEPDEDFPAIDRQRALKQVGNVSEFCLCQQRGVPVPPLSSTTAPTTSSPSKDNLPTNMVMVTLPNSDHIKLRLEEHTTGRDILPNIAKKHRISLYTEDYVFRVLPADQSRLKLSTPDIDMDRPILPLKVKELDLQKRIYADTPKVPDTPIFMAPRPLGADEDSVADLSILYTDVTAAVYQEWAIVKKNKFGRMQERTLGIDGSKIYNSKRDGSSSRNVVHRAQRDISTVRKVGLLPEDHRAFRITYEDEGEINDIEYFCDSVRDCAEIVAKINYLIAKRES